MSEHADDSNELCDFKPPDGSAIELSTGWRTDEVQSLARGIRADLARGVPSEDAPYGMSALADALEEAGCEDTLILNHCRLCTVHTPDCWVLGLILPPDPLDELPEPPGPVRETMDRLADRVTQFGFLFFGVVLLLVLAFGIAYFLR
jgi:hypothetical protein